MSLSGRLALPAAPDYSTINGSRTPAGVLISSTVTVAWRERNRKTASLRYYNDSTEAAEATTDYQIRYRFNNGAWSAATFVSGTSTTLPASSVGTMQVEVTTRRNGTTLSRNSDYVTVPVIAPQGSPQTARYWRFFMPSFNAGGDGYLAMFRIWMFSNQSKYVYSGSEVVNQASNYPARPGSNLFQNSDPVIGSNDSWTSNTGASAPQWVSIDFGSPVTFDAFVVIVDNYNNSIRGPQNFQMQTSDDGVNWTTQGTYATTWSTTNYTQAFTIDTFKLLAADGATNITTPAGDRLRTQ